MYRAIPKGNRLCAKREQDRSAGHEGRLARAQLKHPGDKRVFYPLDSGKSVIQYYRERVYTHMYTLYSVKKCNLYT